MHWAFYSLLFLFVLFLLEETYYYIFIYEWFILEYIIHIIPLKYTHQDTVSISYIKHISSCTFITQNCVHLTFIIYICNVQNEFLNVNYNFYYKLNFYYLDASILYKIFYLLCIYTFKTVLFILLTLHFVFYSFNVSLYHILVCTH